MFHIVGRLICVTQLFSVCLVYFEVQSFFFFRIFSKRTIGGENIVFHEIIIFQNIVPNKHFS